MSDDIATTCDLDQMPFKELRRLVAEAERNEVPDAATFSVARLNRGALLLTWEEPPGSGEKTGLHLPRQCTCGEAECPDRDR